MSFALVFCTEKQKLHCVLLHMFTNVLFWPGNQVNQQNFDPSLLPKKLWLILKKVENFIFCIFRLFFSLCQTTSRLFWNLSSFKLAILIKKQFKIFFCFILMKISQSFMGRKGGSQFWYLSSPKQHLGKHMQPGVSQRNLKFNSNFQRLVLTFDGLQKSLQPNSSSLKIL